MDWNAKPSLHWEWERAAAPITSKPTDNTKIWPSIDWRIDVDDQIASGSLISHQGSSGPSFTSMSKSSKSTSMSSSSTEDKKMFFISKKDDFSRTSPTFESSVCTGEPLLSLKLGKRAYFEDTSDGNNSKRTRSSFHNVSIAYCQVEGCNLDLSSAKDYNRMHKVCLNHSKSSRVVVNGVEHRFCQQCSRFHGLAEFDENKRSCRKRLSDHNARRRRPHPNVPHRALSLLSTDSRPRSVPVSAQGPRLNTTGVIKPWIYGVPSPAPTSELRHAEEQWSSNPERLTMNHEPGNTHNFNNSLSLYDIEYL